MELDRRSFVAGAAAVAASGGARLAIAQSPPVSTGLTTVPMPDVAPQALRVTGMGWFSGFRDSGLRIGDQIVAVDGEAVAFPADEHERSRRLPAMVGGYSEDQRWAARKAGPGTRVTLTLRRRATPGQGWQVLQVSGTLRPPDSTRDAQGRPLLGPGGPVQMGYDGYSDTWQEWADDLAKSASALLDDRLYALAQTNVIELRKNADRAPRVAMLAQTYPGPFARAAQADTAAIQARLLGPEIVMPPDALAYRALNAERADEIRAQAGQAWAALQNGLGEQLIDPLFPAVHPIHGDRASVVGRFAVLPPLRNSDWIGEAGHTWFVAGNSSDGWYFADAEGPEAGLMLDAIDRYRRLVQADIDESYQIVGQVQAEPGQLVVGERAWYGLKLRPVAALVGGAVFVDMRNPGEGVARFAGEGLLRQNAVVPPPDGAAPAAVLQAMIAALKEGDQDLWISLFATWELEWLDDGRPLFRANAQQQPVSYFEEARRRIMERVFDMRPVWVDDVRVLIPGTDYPGQGRLEEVTVEVEHVGRVDGVYRAISDVTVSRWWRLQRLDGGPWRIASLQAI